MSDRSVVIESIWLLLLMLNVPHFAHKFGGWQLLLSFSDVRFFFLTYIYRLISLNIWHRTYSKSYMKKIEEIERRWKTLPALWITVTAVLEMMKLMPALPSLQLNLSLLRRVFWWTLHCLSPLPLVSPTFRLTWLFHHPFLLEQPGGVGVNLPHYHQRMWLLERKKEGRRKTPMSHKSRFQRTHSSSETPRQRLKARTPMLLSGRCRRSWPPCGTAWLRNRNRCLRIVMPSLTNKEGICRIPLLKWLLFSMSAFIIII